MASRCHNRRVQTTGILAPATLSSVRRIQQITIAWMVVEATVSLGAAWQACSPALAAFGGDSAIELLSATIVLWRFRRAPSENSERIAGRLTGALLLVLAGFVAVVSLRACSATRNRGRVTWELPCWPGPASSCHGWPRRSAGSPL